MVASALNKVGGLDYLVKRANQNMFEGGVARLWTNYAVGFKQRHTLPR